MTHDRDDLAAIWRLRDALQDLAEAYPCDFKASQKMQGLPTDCQCETCIATLALEETAGYDEEE